MEDILVPIIVIPTIFVALPWIVLHYITKWKTGATLTSGDETLLEELYQVAKRLDERMDTVERLVAADNPAFNAARLVPDRAVDNQPLNEIELIREASQARARSMGRTAQ